MLYVTILTKCTSASMPLQKLTRIIKVYFGHTIKQNSLQHSIVTQLIVELMEKYGFGFCNIHVQPVKEGKQTSTLVSNTVASTLTTQSEQIYLTDFM